LGTGGYLSSSSPTVIPSLTNITQCSAGLYHTICFGSNDRTFSFGQNQVIYYLNIKFSQLGVNFNYINPKPSIINILKNYNILKICSGLKHTLLLDHNNNLFAFGFNEVILIYYHKYSLIN
jgi:alpha-tubulin suppressor-like RCC1 family protein